MESLSVNLLNKPTPEELGKEVLRILMDSRNEVEIGEGKFKIKIRKVEVTGS